jgi:hypothetical protein
VGIARRRVPENQENTMNRIARRFALAAAPALIATALVGGPAMAGGANTSGPYDPSNVGVDSQNGNGGGKAVGRPAAGTVGNADTKNPKGQLEGPRVDGNNGYECDPQGADDGGNAGIAKGNPAHSSCNTGPQ